MKYRIKKETKPTLPTYGKYKAVAVHYQTVESRQIVKEAAQRMGTHPSNVRGVLLSLAEVINNHLREGDRVRGRSRGDRCLSHTAVIHKNEELC